MMLEVMILKVHTGSLVPEYADETAFISPVLKDVQYIVKSSVVVCV